MGLLDTNNNLSKSAKLAILFFLYFLVTAIVYWTGGTKFAYPHLIYIPILFSAIFFSLTGGVVGGLLSGVVLAIMPLDTVTMQMQPAGNGLIRLIFLTNFGFITGVIFKYIVKQYKRLEDIAYYDLITGLKNIIMLKTRLDELKEKNIAFSLVSISIENILEILNIVGHSQSDLVLKSVADYFKKYKKNGMELYNSYTFRFDFLLIGYDNASVEKWIKAFIDHNQNYSLNLNKTDIFLELVLGAYVSETNNDTSDNIIKKTYTAIDFANGKKHNYAIYKENMDGRFNITVLISEVVNSLKNNHFFIEYQPKLNLEDNKIYGVEALIRWNHPTLGRIPPIDFIPLLEKTNYINSLTYWILDKVTEDIKDWKAKGIDLKISINITPQNLQTKEFTDKILKMADNIKEVFSVELELTESDLMNELDSINIILKEFKDKGIKIYIDDFGTGYSSLAYLKNLPIDFIKIDKSFIKDLIMDENDREIVDTTIKLGHALGKIIVAEGVEDKETFDLLRKLNCNEIQGYYFAKPMPKDKLEEFIMNQ